MASAREGLAQWGVGPPASPPWGGAGSSPARSFPRDGPLFPQRRSLGLGIDFPQPPRWLLMVPIEFLAQRLLPGPRGWR